MTQIEPASDSFVADGLFEKPQRVFNASFNFKEIENNENKILLSFFGPILKQAKCATYLFKDKSGFSSANVQAMCQSLVFGNLATPFEFFEYGKLDFTHNEIKVIFEYNQKLIQVCLLFFCWPKFNLRSRWNILYFCSMRLINWS